MLKGVEIPTGFLIIGFLKILELDFIPELLKDVKKYLLAFYE
tara:strand:+ start:8779 stop:8904 length:126 start_codon:yes stop_codon:yes gene_type:complete